MSLRQLSFPGALVGRLIGVEREKVSVILVSDYKEVEVDTAAVVAISVPAVPVTVSSCELGAIYYLSKVSILLSY